MPTPNQEHFLQHLAAAPSLTINHAILSKYNHSTAFGPRRINSHVIWLVTSGRFIGSHNQKPMCIETGRWHWRQPGDTDHFTIDPHALPLRVYSLRFTLASKLRCPIASTHSMTTSLELDRRFRDLLTLTKVTQDDPDPATRAKLILLMHTLIEITATQHDTQPDTPTGLSPQQKNAVLHYASENLHRGLTPQDLSAAAQLSLDYFTRRFRHTFHHPPRQWIRLQRLNHAAIQLTETTLSIKQVAHQLGYNDQRLFARQFRKQFGMTPSQYRQKTCTNYAPTRRQK